MDLQGTTTLSFYRYLLIANPSQLLLDLRAVWAGMHLKGRVYLAHEGINAQVSLPSQQLEAFRAHLDSIFPDMPLKIALQNHGIPFSKLKIKVRKKLVADGLDSADFDSSQVGRHLDAAAFHAAMAEKDTVIVDMRNHYESEVGHFRGAILPEANTFREALPEMTKRLQGLEGSKILLYCTGGIRCEKASAWLKFKGFQDVNQLHGGIIDYAHQIQAQNVSSQFVGKNFVFDQRMGERVTDDIIAHCHQCGVSIDDHTNCNFEGCNRLFIQCAACEQTYSGCCSRHCQTIFQQSKEFRVTVQHQWTLALGPDHYKSRTKVPNDYDKITHESKL